MEAMEMLEILTGNGWKIGLRRSANGLHVVELCDAEMVVLHAYEDRLLVRAAFLDTKRPAVVLQ